MDYSGPLTTSPREDLSTDTQLDKGQSIGTATIDGIVYDIIIIRFDRTGSQLDISKSHLEITDEEKSALLECATIISNVAFRHFKEQNPPKTVTIKKITDTHIVYVSNDSPKEQELNIEEDTLASTDSESRGLINKLTTLNRPDLLLGVGEETPIATIASIFQRILAKQVPPDARDPHGSTRAVLRAHDDDEALEALTPSTHGSESVDSSTTNPLRSSSSSRGTNTGMRPTPLSPLRIQRGTPRDNPTAASISPTPPTSSATSPHSPDERLFHTPISFPSHSDDDDGALEAPSTHRPESVDSSTTNLLRSSSSSRGPNTGRRPIIPPPPLRRQRDTSRDNPTSSATSPHSPDESLFHTPISSPSRSTDTSGQTSSDVLSRSDLRTGDASFDGFSLVGTGGSPAHDPSFGRESSPRSLSLTPSAAVKPFTPATTTPVPVNVRPPPPPTSDARRLRAPPRLSPRTDSSHLTHGKDDDSEGTTSRTSGRSVLGSQNPSTSQTTFRSPEGARPSSRDRPLPSEPTRLDPSDTTLGGRGSIPVTKRTAANSRPPFTLPEDPRTQELFGKLQTFLHIK